MPLPADILAAMNDPQWFGGSFIGDSWDRHRAILRAAFALPMSDTDLSLFREVAERDPPRRQVSELWMVAGRGSGKDSIASLIAVWFALFGKFNRHTRPGERAVVAVIAVDREQAKICFRYIKAFFEHPLLAELVARDDASSTIELANGVDILILTNSYRAVRGRSLACVVLDEVAFFRDENYVSPDEEVLNALEPGLARMPGSMLVGISTAYRRAGLLFRKWREHYGKPDDDVLVVKGSTPQFNPTFPIAAIDRLIARDPEAARAEYLSEWRSDLADFVPREVVEALVSLGVYELPYLHTYSYFGFTDPSGGSSDSFTLAIAHREGERVVLDCVREVRPPFSPEGVVDEFADVLKSYRLHRVTGDRYAGEFPRELFQKRGVTYEPSEKTKSDLYRELLPLLNSRRVDLLDHAKLVSQLCSLERRTGRGTGKDSIDHPPGAHDDVANAAAGAIVLAGVDSMRIWQRLADNAAGTPSPPQPPADPAPPPRPLVPGPDEVLINCPGHLTVPFAGRVFNLRPGLQVVLDILAQHHIVRKFIVEDEPDAA